MLQEIIENFQQRIKLIIQWIIERIKYIKYIYYVLFIFLMKSLIPNSNLLVEMITLDGLYSSIHAITAYVSSENKDMTESQIITMEPLYTSSALDRYIYYGLQYCTYKLLSWFFWIPDSTSMSLLNYSIILTIIPPLLNIILKTELFNKIRKKKEAVIKTILSKQITNIIQFSSKTYLDKDIVIDYHEIIALFDSYDDTIVYMQYMVKNALIILVLNYVKMYSKTIYYKMIKYAYIYKTGEEIKSFNSITAKKALNEMVNKKRWSDLLNANIYNAILCLFQENIDKVEIFKKLRIKLRNKITKMTAIYTIASFLNSPVLIPLLSIGLYMFNDNNRELTRKNVFKCAIYYVMIPYSFYTESYFLSNIICHFGWEFINNKVVKSIATYADDRTKHILSTVYEKNKEYNKFMILSLTHIIVYKQISLSSILLVMDDVNKSNLYGMLLFVGFISKMNMIRLLCNTGIVYICWGYRDQIGDELNKCIPTIKDIILKNLKVKHHLGCINKIYSNKEKKVIDIKSNYIDNIEEFPSDSYYSDEDEDESHIENIKETKVNTSVFRLSQEDFIDAISVGDDNTSLKKSRKSSSDVIDDFL